MLLPPCGSTEKSTRRGLRGILLWTSESVPGFPVSSELSEMRQSRGVARAFSLDGFTNDSMKMQLNFPIYDTANSLHQTIWFVVGFSHSLNIRD